MALQRLGEKLTKENLWLYILNLLKSEELYAYEIREKIRSAFGFETATITVYVVLYKMEREGLVSSESRKGADGGATRRYYRPTEEGIKALDAGRELLRKTLKTLEGSGARSQ